MNEHFDPEKIRQRIAGICHDARLPAASVCYGSSKGPLLLYDWCSTNDTALIPGSRRYLVASITKPVISMLAMLLVSQGRLRLGDRVCGILDSFCKPGLRGITIRHLLTHTCGLPDMLPENQQLRERHATVADFVEAVSRANPDFVAGTDCRYSSMGYAVLGHLIEHIAEDQLATVLRKSLLEPLGMDSTWLGVPGSLAETILPTIETCQLPIWQDSDCDWNWNSRYWRTLGAPWGGLISTAEDLGRFALLMLRLGRTIDGRPIIPAAAVRASIRNQTTQMSLLPDSVRRSQQWGYGWRMNWNDHSACFCELLPETTFGHWGATGTVFWVCPEYDIWAVVLTAVPYEISQAPIQKISNLLASTC
ncbi:MAG: beta-lactamase family protein [Planctomycetaceae bacterium]|nr:beta-lactamase family protein [Planctomycetaceae bacterium]